jgi:uncharacterized protein (DUF433 family)
MAQSQHIITDPKILMGKPVVAGTRITVELILEKLSAGETFEQLLEAHPSLAREGIRAALSYALTTLRTDIVHPLTSKSAPYSSPARASKSPSLTN